MKIADRQSLAVSFIVFAVLLALGTGVQAQQPKMNRVGVILPGGAWHDMIDGLREGLTQLGVHEGRHVILDVRETKGDVKSTEQIAKTFEQQKFDLLYTTASSVTLAARRATVKIPIVFCAGADPVVLGFVESFSKSGGRLTGVFYRDSDLIAKRLEILKDIVPKLRRLVTFYNPHSPVSVASAKLAKEETVRVGNIELIEKHVGSVEELRAALQSLRTREVDGIFEVTDAMVQTQEQLVIEAAIGKRLPTMFVNHSSVDKGGLAGYSVSRHEIGRVSANHVQRVLAGVSPSDLPVQGVDKIDLIVNLKTAKQIGLTIPPNVLARADRVIK